MQDFNPDYKKVVSYFERFVTFKRQMMYFIIRYINEPTIDSEEANRIRKIWRTDSSKINAICKEFGLKGFDNMGFIYLIVIVHNDKEERIQNRIEATEYWLQLKSLIDSLESYEIPGLLEANKTEANRFNEIRFYPKRDTFISISNPKLIFNLVTRMLPFLWDHYDKSEYDEMLGEIMPFVGLKNAPDGFRITRDKLMFSINDYLTKEESHLSQTKRSRVIKELLSLLVLPPLPLLFH